MGGGGVKCFNLLFLSFFIIKIINSINIRQYFQFHFLFSGLLMKHTLRDDLLMVDSKVSPVCNCG